MTKEYDKTADFFEKGVKQPPKPAPEPVSQAEPPPPPPGSGQGTTEK